MKVANSVRREPKRRAALSGTGRRRGAHFSFIAIRQEIKETSSWIKFLERRESKGRTLFI